MAQSSRTFRIFVSSTFSDLKAERNALQQYVFPRLRDLAMAHGCRFQAIDLRWGVSEEAALDQQTMKICLTEIERCRMVSPKPNFIILMGDRFGWRPLPYVIHAEELKKLLPHISVHLQQSLLWNENQPEGQKGWYRLDTNAIPPEYVLQQRGSDSRYADYQTWVREVEQPLVRALEEAALNASLDETDLQKYTLSATGQEIVKGALEAEDSQEHVFAFLRSFTNLAAIQQNAKAQSVYDQNPDGFFDTEAHQNLVALKAKIQTRLPGNIYTYQAAWQEGGLWGSPDNKLPDTLEECRSLGMEGTLIADFCDAVYERLSRVILAEAGKVRSIEEQYFHDEFGKNRAKFFVGRGEILRQVADHLVSNNTHPLFVWGPSGSGKSALMAKSVQETREKFGEKIILISRFIGATPESSNGRALLESLCKQISSCYGADPSNIPLEYNDLIKELPKRLALAKPDKPLFIFLDALDQLSDTDNARSLNWLPIDFPANVFIIVSSIPGESLQILRDKLPGKNLLEVWAMTTADAKSVLEKWFQEAKRRLQDHQEQYLIKNFTKTGLPLYLKLSFEEARLWKSYDPIIELRDDILGILGDLFKRLSRESNHGGLLVSRSLGYLAAAKNGLSEDEMLDVLWSDEEVRANFFLRSPKSPKDVRSLPIVVWSRLFLDLEPYLSERNVDGTSLLMFYHRQLSESVQAAYLAGVDRFARNRILAAYFENQPLRRVVAGSEKPNLRKLSEQPYQQARAGLDEKFIGTLTDYNFLQAKVSALEPGQLIEDYNLVSEFSDTLTAGKALRLIQGALRLSAPYLAIDPTRLPGQLAGRLAGMAEAEIHHLLEAGHDCAVKPYLYPLTPALSAPTGPLVQVLHHHTQTVDSLSISPDGRWMVSGSRDGMICVWGSTSGRLERTLGGGTGGFSKVTITPDSGSIISGSNDGKIRVWNLANGLLERTLEGHSGSVYALVVMPDGRRFISGGRDGKIHVWDRKSGQLERTIDGLTETISALAVTPDGRRFISGGADGKLRIWTFASAQLENTLEGHHVNIREMAVTPDGNRLVSCGGYSTDYSVKIWELANGQLERALVGDEHPVHSLAVSSDGSRIISGGFKAVRVWNIASGQIERIFENIPTTVNEVAIMPDGSRIASSGYDETTVRLWNFSASQNERTPEHHKFNVNGVTITPDGKRIVSCSSAGGEVFIWDSASGRFERKLDRGATADGILITPDGTKVIGVDGWTLAVWDLASGQLERTFHHTDIVDGVAITPDGRRIVTGSKSAKTVQVWNLESGRLEHSLEGHTGPVGGGVTISPDGRWIVSGSDDQTVMVWNLASGRLERTLKIIGKARGVAITPDGRRIISGSTDHNIRVWDFATGGLEKTLVGHTDWVSAVAVTSDSRKIVSTSINNDRKVRLWNITTGQEIASWIPDTGNIATACCAFPADASLVVYGDSAGSVNILRLLEEQPPAVPSSQPKVEPAHRQLFGWLKRGKS